MFADEQLEQLRRLMREENGAVEKRLNVRIDGLERRIDDVEQRVTAKIEDVTEQLGKKIVITDARLGRKMDHVDEELGHLVAGVMEHHTKLDQRVERIEEHLDLPKLH